MSLRADVVVDRGQFSLEAAVEVAAGETVAIVGPSGAGKSSLLRAIAGFDAIRAGRVSIDDEIVEMVGHASAPVHVPSEKRGIGYITQSPHLFPHLSALDNVAFGLRAAGIDKRAARRAALPWLVRVGVEHRAGALPSTLSGGEARRVAVARALAPQPRLLLLDEPLTGLDHALKESMRGLVWSELAAFTGARLLVTHDPVEAIGVASRIVVIEGGRIVQDDTTAAIAERPKTQFAAEVVGVNSLTGTAAGDTVTLSGAGQVAIAEPTEGPVVLVFHPSAVALHRTRPEGSARNVWPAVVAGLELAEQRVRVRLSGLLDLVAEVTPAAVSDLGLRPGLDVWASVKATEVTVLVGRQPFGERGPAS